MGAKDMLAQMAGSAPAKKRGKKEKPRLTDPELAADIAEFLENKRLEDTAKALKTAAQDRIVARARPFLLEQCAAAGALLSSVDVTAGGDVLTMTHQNRYSEIPAERVEAVREAFGPDAERFLNSSLKVSLTPGAANDEAVLETLLKKLGPDFVKRHFVIEQPVAPTAAFHEAFYTRAEVRKAAEPFVAEQTIKQATPSLKLA